MAFVDSRGIPGGTHPWSLLPCVELAVPLINQHNTAALPACLTVTPPLLPSPPAGPRALAFNPAENAVLVQTDVEGGSYELYAVPKDAAGREVAPVRPAVGWCKWAVFGRRASQLPGAVRLGTACAGQWAQAHPAAHPCPLPSAPASPHSLQDAKRGFSAAAVFIARNRFAVLDKSGNQLIIKDLANEVGGINGLNSSWWLEEG